MQPINPTVSKAIRGSLNSNHRAIYVRLVIMDRHLDGRCYCTWKWIVRIQPPYQVILHTESRPQPTALVAVGQSGDHLPPKFVAYEGTHCKIVPCALRSYYCLAGRQLRQAVVVCYEISVGRMMSRSRYWLLMCYYFRVTYIFQVYIASGQAGEAADYTYLGILST